MPVSNELEERSAPFVRWDERFATNIPLIDEQHKELFRLTNELFKSCVSGDVNAAFKDAMKSAVDYVRFHFSAEEKMLVNVHYPDIAAHKKAHETFVKRILEDAENFKEGKKLTPFNFVRFLRDWILSHIAVMDMQYASYIKGLKKGGQLDTVLENKP